jgi:feruloyl esterase
VHRTAVTAKALTASYYQKPISRSYFTGCSRGGGQGVVAAIRYPKDFDAIAAGAPAIIYNGVAALATRINQAMYPDPNDLSQAVVGPEAEKLIKRSYLAACDALDGLEDGILNDPRQCHFDVASLQCTGDKTDECLTAEELTAVNAIYDDFQDPDGNTLMAGFNYGGEDSAAGWSRWLTGGLKGFSGEFQEGVGSGGFEAPPTPSAYYAFGNDLMRYFFYQDPDWTYVNYDFSNYLKDSAAVAETLNGTNPDLSEFRARGGKMILYNGWSDAAVPSRETLRYYEKVLAFDPSAAEDIRLFLMPGMDHCFGGDGPSYVNFLNEIDKWSQTDKAPDQITAYWLDAQRQPTGSRPVCAYPRVAKYDGLGNPRDASSFVCELGN